ncbi:hypothetical protein NDU88_000664 [Pleurodeles waltl]|uniref:Uncharacterized protein n=1 Tax=Pleurodeles waltl TaxID=8319 RepID=A0AAV7V917_PLEWA|nr:hypothetical protein NDU88_000664 [Pleurodeles waltl]
MISTRSPVPKRLPTSADGGEGLRSAVSPTSFHLRARAASLIDVHGLLHPARATFQLTYASCRPRNTAEAGAGNPNVGRSRRRPRGRPPPLSVNVPRGGQSQGAPSLPGHPKGTAAYPLCTFWATLRTGRCRHRELSASFKRQLDITDKQEPVKKKARDNAAKLHCKPAAIKNLDGNSSPST